ncbi:hypothetical protein ABU43_RS19700, partial [Escherichia coli]
VFLVILFTSFSGSLVSRISGAVHIDSVQPVQPVQPVQNNIIGDLLRKSRKEARRAGRKQKRWEGACKALQEPNKYRDLINELSE